MSKLVRCKPCGYIAKEGRLRRVCPACGASLSAFEPHQDRVSARRRMILNLDLHPILVHTPQTFATFLPLLVACTMLLPKFYPTELAAVVAFMVLVLPISVVGAMLSGLIDGKMKFKRLGRPAIIWKSSVGSCLLVLSAANALVLLTRGSQGGAKAIVLALGVGSLVCAILLGRAGKKLIAPVLPGK